MHGLIPPPFGSPSGNDLLNPASLGIPSPLRMIVLAGGKANTDPLAQHFGQSHRCLIPLANRPLIAHVLQTAALHPAIESLAVSVEADAFAGIFDVLSQLPGRGIVKLVEAKSTLTDSVYAAAEDWNGPLLITTADHALLSMASIDAMIEALKLSPSKNCAAIAMTSHDAIFEAGITSPPEIYAFSDGFFSNCNIYAASNLDALKAAEVFRDGQGFTHNSWRTLRAFGLINLILIRMRALSLGDGMERISKRLGIPITPVMIDDGSQAIDVNTLHTHMLVENLIKERDSLPLQHYSWPDPRPSFQ